MKKMNYVRAATAMAVLAIGSLSVAGKMGKPETIEGTLVDSKCYSMMHENSGNDHQTPKGPMKNCAAACAMQGIPVAVLQKNERLTILLAPAGTFAPHMTKHVRVVGMVPSKGLIIPDKVEVESADGQWEEVKIATMDSK